MYTCIEFVSVKDIYVCKLCDVLGVDFITLLLLTDDSVKLSGNLFSPFAIKLCHIYISQLQ